MAIQIYCSSCYTSNGLDAKKCSNCAQAFGRDKKYRVSVSVKGKRATRVVDNLTIAREVEAALKGDLVRDEFDIADHKPQEKPLTLADLWDKFLPWAQQNKKTWKCDQYNYSTHLEPRFGKKGLDSITPLDVERMKVDLKKGINKQGRPFTPATIKHQLVLLKRLYNLAKRWGIYIGENPLDRVEIPKLDNQKTEFLSDDEADRLMRVLDSWPCQETVSFIRFAMFTGVRRGELFKLTWDAVDFERSAITLRTPKGGKTTTIPISDSAMNVLRGLTATSQYVFPGKYGSQRTDFKKPWQKIRKAAGLPADFRFCGLRHNFATQLISNNVDLSMVQGLLTHKDSRTTQRYAHFLPGALQKAAQKSGELLAPKHGQVLKIVK
jgi:integrase/ribosomal protein L40E